MPEPPKLLAGHIPQHFAVVTTCISIVSEAEVPGDLGDQPN